MWQSILDGLLKRTFRRGTLHVVFPDGETGRYGDGAGEPVRVHVRDSALLRRIVRNPELAVGEGYMDGTITIEKDDLRGFLAVAARNMPRGAWWRAPLETTSRILRRSRQLAPLHRARRNVAHHYDLSEDLYTLFLDADRQYSCAYFANPDMTLDEAQAAKKAHIAAKLCLEPGMRVLDIGCGWGGMALTLARDHGASVVGITLSEEQHRVACARAEAEGLGKRVDFQLCDYRTVEGTFDRIVSVGMFEHVGVPHYREYFRTVRERLSVEGIALIHTIGRISPPGMTGPWIEKYIFPGGYVPALSEMSAAIEKEELYFTDIEVLRMHYAETLRHWHDRFVAQEARARELYDERFCRMWRFYLAASEMSFRHGRQAVFQVQLAHRQDAVPITRDYLHRTHEVSLRHAAE